MGGILAGTEPRLAVSPHAGVSLSSGRGFLFSVRDQCNVLPAINALGVGVYNHTSAAIGYAFDKVEFSVGPTLSIYSMPACGELYCGRVVGVSPGGQAQALIYFAGPVGVSVSANVDWIGGRSLVLPGGVAATVAAGPVLRWSLK